MAFERLLVSFRPERILHDGPELLVVDKPRGMVVHGGDERLAGDLVSRLRRFLRESGRDDYLGVHQRLDAPTSGVLLFTRRREANPAVAEAFAGRRSKKRYVAVVHLGARAPGALLQGKWITLEHRLATHDGRTRVVSSGGDLARSRARVVSRRGELALVELELETGRTHQLRVQLAASGAPVLGDPLYGDVRHAPAPRLMLHAERLELPDGRAFEAEVPAIFARALAGALDELGSPVEQEEALADAACLREPLAARATAFRLVNDAADLLPGVTIDRYADFAVLSVSSPAAEAAAGRLAELLVEGGAKGVYLKRRLRADLRKQDHAELAPERVFRGEPAPDRVEVTEGDMKLWVELGGKLGTGLFVDQRDGRARVRELAAGGRVLNLFSYTSSFSVAAALGGATRVVSVDLSRRVLEIARENFRLNGLDPQKYEFYQADALSWMEKREKKGERFSLVVLDPPSFSSEGSGKAFNVREHYSDAAELSLRLLEPGGMLLAVTNHRKTSLERLRKTLREAAARAGRRVEQLKDAPSPLDCPPLPEGPHPSKSVFLRLAR
jgi:23S rRNA (cytosine1962-C5)-methyltransferase